MAQSGSALARSLKAFKASGYQNECKVQTAWLNAFWAVGLHEIGKLTSSMIGPSPAPVGAAATVSSARADDHSSGRARSVPAARCFVKRLLCISLSCDAPYYTLRHPAGFGHGFAVHTARCRTETLPPGSAPPSAAPRSPDSPDRSQVV